MNHATNAACCTPYSSPAHQSFARHPRETTAGTDWPTSPKFNGLNNANTALLFDTNSGKPAHHAALGTTRPTTCGKGATAVGDATSWTSPSSNDSKSVSACRTSSGRSDSSHIATGP